MPWLKLDTSFTEHSKLVEVGAEAGWLHVAALCYSARLLTDGRVPMAQVRLLAALKRPQQAVDKLLGAGLWEDCGDHYVIHDYLIHQSSRAEVERTRKDAAERMRRSREVRANKGNRSQELRELEVEVDVQIPQSPQSRPVDNPTLVSESFAEIKEKNHL